ncbi:hypothetical protein [Kitasatospora sp. MBT66]|uniref:hypothetical protein n=1 Tax=Kitasatospora sp. MBT66 TaxID=1444769 RepID=UPI000A96FF31|nr:hypothetical protein [Kitasatospora sp. MBT66]
MIPEMVDLINAVRADLAERALPSPVATLAVALDHSYPEGPAYEDTLTATLLDGSSVEINFGSAIADELIELADTNRDIGLQEFIITLIKVPSQPTRSYTVSWFMDVEAHSYREAAEKAWAAQRRQGTTASVFTVEAPDGTRVEVDLTEDTETPVA